MVHRNRQVFIRSAKPADYSTNNQVERFPTFPELHDSQNERANENIIANNCNDTTPSEHNHTWANIHVQGKTHAAGKISQHLKDKSHSASVADGVLSGEDSDVVPHYSRRLLSDCTKSHRKLSRNSGTISSTTTLHRRARNAHLDDYDHTRDHDHLLENTFQDYDRAPEKVHDHSLQNYGTLTSVGKAKQSHTKNIRKDVYNANGNSWTLRKAHTINNNAGPKPEHFPRKFTRRSTHHGLTSPYFSSDSRDSPTLDYLAYTDHDGGLSQRVASGSASHYPREVLLSDDGVPVWREPLPRSVVFSNSSGGSVECSVVPMNPPAVVIWVNANGRVVEEVTIISTYFMASKYSSIH